MLSDEIPSREHYLFSGWATDPERLTVRYQAGSVFQGDADCTLYAVWSPQLEGSILEIPLSVTDIEEEAFAGANSRNIVVNSNCGTIGPRAFADNPSLSAVVMLSADTEIDPEAFSGCGQLIIYGQSDSTAQTFAEEKNYLFCELDSFTAFP